MVGLGTGVLKFAFDYDAYGNSERTWTNTSTPWTNQRYAGLFYHPTSGLYLSATRAYSSAIGRWINRDSISRWDYIYGGASPLLRIDPSGNGWRGAAIGAVLGGAGGVAAGPVGVVEGALIGAQLGDGAEEFLNALFCPRPGYVGVITSRAARRDAMRQIGAPTSRPFVDAQGDAIDRQYIFEDSDGGFVVVSHHGADEEHPSSHWHAAPPKTDPETGLPRTGSQGQWKYGSGGGVASHEENLPRPPRWFRLK
jgi:RHS repeat-associated protein